MSQLTQLNELHLYQRHLGKSVRKIISILGTLLALKEPVLAILLWLGDFSFQMAICRSHIGHWCGRRKAVSSLSPYLAPVNYCTIYCSHCFVFSTNRFHVNRFLPYVTFCIWLFFLLALCFWNSFILLYLFFSFALLSSQWNVVGGRGNR